MCIFKMLILLHRMLNLFKFKRKYLCFSSFSSFLKFCFKNLNFFQLQNATLFGSSMFISEAENNSAFCSKNVTFKQFFWLSKRLI